ncbi:hypothetical protein EDC01DRAFT_784406 [Geopyxis carbonaria]|nr:hypothetical protein EDC01DRAFT_784406 [Geopyxis carbonaria]
MSSLTGKIALITGSSKGIGAAIARNLASRGCTIVLNYSSPSSAAADTVLASLPAATPPHTALRADVSALAACQTLIAAVIATYSTLDILVLNAGWMPHADLASTTEADFDRCFALNVKGPYFLAQAAAPHMPTDGSARMVFFSTSLTAANTITPNYTLYLASKGAVEQMVHALSKDLGRRGIAVNAVSPGPTGTALFYEGKSEAVVEMIARMSPAGRIGRPEEVAEVVGFLVGPEGAWVMGQNWRVNGGFV